MKRGTPKPREVFFSHAARDHQFAHRIVQVLFQHRIPVFYSPIIIVGAQQWHDEIGAALARCDWFMLLLSPQAVRSKWVKHELLFALREAQYENRIPLRYKPCSEAKLSWTLPGFQYIDFTGPFRDGCRALLGLWGIGLKAMHADR